MKSIAVLLLSMALFVGCAKNRSEDKQVSQTAVAPDNSGRNVRDRNDQTKTAEDQSESEADRAISQNIRQAITADDSLSTNGKNVKIITSDGVVTLRGPVKSDKEKSTIGAKAQQVAGVKNVDNQLEITN
jgi:hyperosmotically inducible periplasmic protein